MATALPVLIGQFDSPFVRRVAIAMSLYGRPFEHRKWSVFRDAALIAEYNPLHRVPTLLLESGEVLVESSAILDALDDEAPDESLLLPRRGPERRAGLRVAALACGLADKGVALVYENVAREAESQSTRWRERCLRQVEQTLLLLEKERAQADVVAGRTHQPRRHRCGRRRPLHQAGRPGGRIRTCAAFPFRARVSLLRTGGVSQHRRTSTFSIVGEWGTQKRRAPVPCTEALLEDALS